MADRVALWARDLQCQLGMFVAGPFSFSVSVGNHTGIIGPSGSGKSTLLRMLSLFVPPARGSLSTQQHTFSFTGPDLTLSADLVANHRRSVAYVAQQNLLWPHLAVVGNIEVGLIRVLRKNNEEARIIALDLLAALDIAHLADKRTWEISGGEARRVAVARAIAMSPSILLLDEPDTGLDPIRSRIQMELILAVAERGGATAIIVSHNPAVIQFCEQVLVVDKGHIQEYGPAPEIFNEPQSPAARMLVESAAWTSRRSAL